LRDFHSSQEEKAKAAKIRMQRRKKEKTLEEELAPLSDAASSFNVSFFLSISSNCAHCSWQTSEAHCSVGSLMAAMMTRGRYIDK